MTNYYEILGLEPGATDKSIKQAYYKFARDLHPDKATNDQESKKNEHLFAEISKAYNVLKDKNRRKEYDLTLNKKNEADYVSSNINSGSPSSTGRKRNTFKKKTYKASVSRQSITSDHSKEKKLIAKKAYALGTQVYKVGDYKKAVTLFTAAIENDDNVPVYYYRLAQAMMKSHKSFNTSVDMINKAIEMDPYNMDYKLLLGEIYENAGALSMAKKIYEEILKWDKSNEKVKIRMKFIGMNVNDGKREPESFFGKLFKKMSGK